MPHLRARWALLLTVASVCIAGLRAETLRLRADTWMPYNGEPGAQPAGYAIDLAREIFKPAGVTLDYANMPWGDALKAAAAGQIDAVVGANKEEAAGLVLPAECIGYPRVALVVAKTSTWRYTNVASLRTVRLGVIADYKYWPALDDYIAKNKAPQIVFLTGDRPLEHGLTLLQQAKLDVIAETSSVFAWAVKSGGHAAGDFHTVYLHEGDPVYFAFAPGPAGERFARRFDAGIREMRKNGRLAAILARYGLTDWIEAAP